MFASLVSFCTGDTWLTGIIKYIDIFHKSLFHNSGSHLGQPGSCCLVAWFGFKPHPLCFSVFSFTRPARYQSWCATFHCSKFSRGIFFSMVVQSTSMWHNSRQWRMHVMPPMCMTAKDGCVFFSLENILADVYEVLWCVSLHYWFRQTVCSALTNTYFYLFWDK